VRRDDKTEKIDHLPNGKKDVSDAIAGKDYQTIVETAEKTN
jgi:hypothetical protein